MKKLTKLQQKRWEVALSEVERINKYINRKGFYAIDDKSFIEKPFEVRKDYEGFWYIQREICENGYCVYFKSNPNFDEGIHDTIPQIRNRFRKIKILKCIN